MNEFETAQSWIEGSNRVPRADNIVRVECREQGWGILRNNISLTDAPLCLNGRQYAHGLGSHADSKIVLHLPVGATRFSASVGVDDNPNTRRGYAEIQFAVTAGEDVLWQSRTLTVADEPDTVDLDVSAHREITLTAREMRGNISLAHADWADARVTRQDGSEIWVYNDNVPDGPPISFTYDGAFSADLLPKWNRTQREVPASAGVTMTETTFTDSATGLQCVFEQKRFDDFPAVEWVVRFKNTGTKDTPILENIQALDMTWPVGQEMLLHHSLGSHSEITDFLPHQDSIKPSESIRMSPSGGRSSNDWLPFFNVQTGAEGFIGAVGWTGEWAVSFNRDAGPLAIIQAGMAKTHLKLLPGEEIRTPRILLVFWQGDPIDGHNTLRRLILKHHTPIVDDQPLQAPLACATWGGAKSDFHFSLIEQIQQHKLPYDCYWIDAGWYGISPTESPDVFTGDWAVEAGNWVVNAYRHPNGLRPISDAAHKAGMKFLLWFELERALVGTKMPQEHPEWYLGDLETGKNLLFNLGIPEACEWLTDYLSNAITEFGLDWYRQDFNFEPLPYWTDADAPDRQGMSEIKYITGLYAFLDGIRERHPHLCIDNCASGGRRLDLEMTSRSMPLWRSDLQCAYVFDPIGSQAETMGLSYWLPLSACGCFMRDNDTYDARSEMSAGFIDQGFAHGLLHMPAEVDMDWHRQTLLLQKRASPFYYGDYYPLTPCTVDPSAWMVYQMHRPDLNAGIVAAFRRPDSPFNSGDFPLRGLDPSMEYDLEDADGGSAQTIFGNDLLEQGLSVQMPQRRQSRLIFYQAKGKS